MVNDSNKDLISAISMAAEKLNRSIVISIGKLISVVILSSFLIIVSIINKYAACIVIVGYIIVYAYNKMIDFINRIPNKRFEEFNPNQNQESDEESKENQS